MILGIDEPLPEQVITEINALPNVYQTSVVQL